MKYQLTIEIETTEFQEKLLKLAEEHQLLNYETRQQSLTAIATDALRTEIDFLEGQLIDYGVYPRTYNV